MVGGWNKGGLADDVGFITDDLFRQHFPRCHSDRPVGGHIIYVHPSVSALFCPLAPLAVRRAQYSLTKGPKDCKNPAAGGVDLRPMRRDSGRMLNIAGFRDHNKLVAV
jgi:hypothetical protein